MDNLSEIKLNIILHIAEMTDAERADSWWKSPECGGYDYHVITELTEHGLCYSVQIGTEFGGDYSASETSLFDAVLYLGTETF